MPWVCSSVLKGICAVITALSSTAVIGQYKPHDSLLSGQGPKLQELSRNLGRVMANMIDIIEIEHGQDTRLHLAMHTAMKPMKEMQEQLAREGFPRSGWTHTELFSYLRTTGFHVIDDPPPLLFLAACIAYTFAIVNLRSLHKADRCQDRILAAGCAVGVVGAIVSQDPFQELKKYLAWSAFLALVLSSLLHRLVWMGLDPGISVSIDEGVEVEIEKGRCRVGA